MNRKSLYPLKILCCSLGLFFAGLSAAHADGVAINRVRGGIRGIDNNTLKNGDGTNDAMVTIRIRQLDLIKQARTLNGRILTAQDAVARGQRIWFIFIIENDVESALEDVQLLDELLDSEFEYVNGSLQEIRLDSNGVSFNGGEEDSIWKNTWRDLSDGKDNDIVSVNVLQKNGAQSHAIAVGGSQNDGALNISANTLWALRFQVRVKGSGQ